MASPDQSRFSKKISSTVAMCLTGVSVGWMSGLSASPVVQTILSTVLSVAAPLLAALIGIKLQSEEVSEDGGNADPSAQATPPTSSSFSVEKPKTLEILKSIEVTAWPLTCFVFFLAVGSSCGLLARTNDFLGLRPRWVMKRWLDVALVGPPGSQSTQTSQSAEVEVAKPSNSAARDPCALDVRENCLVHRLLDVVYPSDRPEVRKEEKPNEDPKADPKQGNPHKGGSSGRHGSDKQINLRGGALIQNTSASHANACTLSAYKLEPRNAMEINSELRQLGSATCSDLSTPDGVQNCQTLIHAACSHQRSDFKH